ncbi:MAG: site-2 protease family protein [Acidobacteriaceae bacterium]
MMDPATIIIFVLILLFSVIFHEVAHGLVADKLGDPTARYAGRLTLNPIPHIDIVWSILLPAILIFIGSPFIFGAAKPVPVDYRNFKNLKRDMLLVALVGPLANLLLAVLAALTIRLTPGLSGLGETLLMQTVVLNVVLAMFNLIPIPPLDGSKVLTSLLGFINRSYMYWMFDLERYGFIILIILLFTGLLGSIITPPVDFFLRLFLGSGARL